MQQFTVPQFIDVEDKILGPVTVRQFLIILSAAILVGVWFKFLGTGAFIALTAVTVIFSLVLAFVKVNGRPFHFFILNAMQTITRANLRIWNKRVSAAIEHDTEIMTKVQKAEPAGVSARKFSQSRLAELSLIVDTQGSYKGEKNKDEFLIQKLDSK